MRTSTITLRIPHPTRLPLRLACLMGDAQVSDADGVDEGSGFDRRKQGWPAHADADSDSRDSGLLFDVLRVVEQFYHRIAQALDGAGLSVARYELLQYLDDANDPVTPRRAADDLGSTLSSVTRLMNRLESDGLVRCIEDPYGGPVPRREITPLGSAKAEAGGARLEIVQALFGASLADGEHIQLLRLLQRPG